MACNCHDPIHSAPPNTAPASMNPGICRGLCSENTAAADAADAAAVPMVATPNVLFNEQYEPKNHPTAPPVMALSTTDDLSTSLHTTDRPLSTPRPLKSTKNGNTLSAVATPKETPFEAHELL